MPQCHFAAGSSLKFSNAIITAQLLCVPTVYCVTDDRFRRTTRERERVLSKYRRFTFGFFITFKPIQSILRILVVKKKYISFQMQISFDSKNK